MRAALSNGDIFNDLDRPLIWIWRSQHTRSRISQKRYVLGKSYYRTLGNHIHLSNCTTFN